MNDSRRAGLKAEGLTGWRGQMHQDEDKDARLNGEPRQQKEDHVVLPREAQGRIGQHLRRIYGEILAEPLPDKLSKLLDELAKSERSE